MLRQIQLLQRPPRNIRPTHKDSPHIELAAIKLQRFVRSLPQNLLRVLNVDGRADHRHQIPFLQHQSAVRELLVVSLTNATENQVMPRLGGQLGDRFSKCRRVSHHDRDHGQLLLQLSESRNRQCFLRQVHSKSGPGQNHHEHRPKHAHGISERVTNDRLGGIASRLGHRVDGACQSARIRKRPAKHPCRLRPSYPVMARRKVSRNPRQGESRERREYALSTLSRKDLPERRSRRQADRVNQHRQAQQINDVGQVQTLVNRPNREPHKQHRRRA